MKIIILQHIKIEDPGYKKELMLADGFNLTTIEFDEGEKISYHQRRIDLLTPVVKGWCTENSIEVTSLGVSLFFL